MAKERISNGGRAFHLLVTVAGSSLWLYTAVSLLRNYALQDQLIMLAVTLLILAVSMIQLTFPFPSGLKLTHEKFNFTLSDAIVLLIACWQGLTPAVFVAGIEGFASSRRSVSRLSSNLFSLGMMSLAAAAAAASLNAVLFYGWGRTGVRNQTFLAVAVALFVASIIHLIVNTALFSTLLALRYNTPIGRTWKENYLWAAPMFLPTSAAATLMYLALHHGALTMTVIGGTVLAALYFWHRQYGNSVQERINILEKAHRETIEALAVAINAKDEVTHEHVLRVQIYAAGVARILGCTTSEVEALKAGALLHDIGKIAVPDYILNKPGKLTAAEFDQMKLHTIVGAQILGRVEFPYPVVPIVRHHHERWDGRGYPDGLRGEEIPLIARILSVVDCFDAVREDRQYRKGMTREAAIDLIMEGSGTQYDPRVVGTFITHLPEFEAEIQALRDTPLPTFGLEPAERLSEAARQVAPAAGLAKESQAKPDQAAKGSFSHEELKKLYDLAQAISAARRGDEVLAVFTEKLATLVPFDSCAVTLVAPDSGDHKVAHVAGQHAALLRDRQIARGEGVTGWVIANLRPFCNTDPKLDLPPALASHFSSYRTLAVFPLLRGKEMLGAVSLYSASLSEYSQDHQRLLEEAVALVASALSTSKQVASTKIRLQTLSGEGSSLETAASAALESGLTH